MDYKIIKLKYFIFRLYNFNSCSAKLNNLISQPLEVVSRYRDPQLQVAENYSWLFNRLVLVVQHEIFANIDV